MVGPRVEHRDITTPRPRTVREESALLRTEGCTVLVEFNIVTKILINLLNKNKYVFKANTFFQEN